MILMMSFIGLKVGGIPGAVASALATFGPPCAMYYLSYRLWDRFRDMPWQRIVRRGLAPLTIGLVIAGGYVMARSAAVGWPSVAITAAAVALMLGARLNPLWILTGRAAHWAGSGCFNIGLERLDLGHTSRPHCWGSRCTMVG